MSTSIGDALHPVKSYLAPHDEVMAMRTTSVTEDGKSIGINNPVYIEHQSNHHDSFGKLRVTSPFTLLDFKQNRDNLPLFFDDQQTSGSGTTSTYNTNKASTTIGVSANTAGTRVRQSKMWGNYQPGKSQMILLTGNFKGHVSGVTKRIGYFWDRWGLFFESNGTNMGVVVRTYNTGSAVDTRVAQANWNIDKMDGTGVSGVTVDWSKVQIMLIDFEWLGVGLVRYALVIDGEIYYVHHAKHANINTEVYSSNPNAPIRYEISNNGTGAAATLDQICASVISEGGQEQTSITTYVSRDGTPITLANQDLFTPVLSVRVKSDQRCTRVVPIEVSVLTTTNTNYEWALFINPTIASVDAASWVDVTNSAIQYDQSRTNANTLTGGYKISGGYGSSSATSKISITGASKSHLTIGSSITGTMDELVLGVKNIDANGGTCYAGITLTEYC